MQHGIPDNESTRAANTFRACLEKGENPKVCVKKLEGEYPWLSNVNFSDLVLLYW